MISSTYSIKPFKPLIVYSVIISLEYRDFTYGQTVYTPSTPLQHIRLKYLHDKHNIFARLTSWYDWGIPPLHMLTICTAGLNLNIARSDMIEWHYSDFFFFCGESAYLLADTSTCGSRSHNLSDQCGLPSPKSGLHVRKEQILQHKLHEPNFNLTLESKIPEWTTRRSSRCCFDCCTSKQNCILAL